MAEPTGKDTPATDPKSVVGKTGPVKPPVLEGTARPSTTTSASTAKPAASATASTPGSKPADKPGVTGPTTTTRPAGGTAPRPKDQTEAASSGGAWLAGIVGGVIGLGAAYGLAWFGLWPTPAQPATPADPRLAQITTAIPELQTITSTVQDELATLNGRVGALESSQAEAPAAGSAGTDPALAEQVANLSAQLDALTASTGTAGGSEDLTALQAEVATLKADLASANAQLAQTQQQVTSLSQSADESAGAEAASARLPLIFSGLDSAFDSGRAYESELSALRQALPESRVPEALSGRAIDGLPRPDTVSARLTAVLPDMLAGRPAEENADWQSATADWFRGLVAMRPTGDVEGDTPDAIVARLEAAVERRDFVAAKAELDALPAPMRAAAGDVAGDIEVLAAAQTFLTRLRDQVLNGENGA